MTAFARQHNIDKSLGNLAYISGQKVTRTLQLNHRYSVIKGVLKVSLKGAGTAPSGMAQEGILALIQGMFITVNGSSTAKHQTCGRQIFIDSIERNRKNGTTDDVDLAADYSVTQNFTVHFNYNFSPANINLMEAREFALDLLNETRNPSALTSAEISVNWGNISDMFGNPGTLEIENASIDLWADEVILWAGTADNPAVYDRSNELISRKLSKDFAATDTYVEFEIPRISNSLLLGFSVAQYWRKSKNDFQSNLPLIVSHDSYDWRSIPVGYIQDKQNAALDDVAGNILFMPLTEYGLLNTAMVDADFTENIKVKVPVNPLGQGAPTDGLSVMLIAHYAKAPSLN